MNICVQLGMRVRYLREQKGWSQIDLANYSSINRNYISDLERGKRNPTLEIINRLADSFNISISELMKGLQSFE